MANRSLGPLGANSHGVDPGAPSRVARLRFEIVSSTSPSGADQVHASRSQITDARPRMRAHPREPHAPRTARGLRIGDRHPPRRERNHTDRRRRRDDPIIQRHGDHERRSDHDHPSAQRAVPPRSQARWRRSPGGSTTRPPPVAIVAQAVHRVQNSSALSGAPSTTTTAPAAESALRALTGSARSSASQVLRGGRVLAQTGSGQRNRAGARLDPGHLGDVRALHAVRPQLPAGRTPGHRRASGAARRCPTRLAGTIDGLPSAGLPAEGPVTLAGQSFQTSTLTGAVYPSGTLHIVLLAPTAGISCPGSPAQTRVETLGHVGEHIYQEELHSPAVAETVRHIENSSAFQHAVAAGTTPPPSRAAIVGSSA